MAGHVVGLDLSLTATGVATGARTATLRTPKRGMDRLDWLCDRVMEHAAGAELVVVELYAYGAKGRAVTGLAELGGTVRLELHRAGITYADVPPTSLKKYATGKGNAPKAAVLAAARSATSGTVKDDNQADAWWLRQMGLTHLGDPDAVPVGAVQLDALAKVAWTP